MPSATLRKEWERKKAAAEAPVAEAVVEEAVVEPEPPVESDEDEHGE